MSLHPLSLEPLRARLYSLLVGGMEREPARGGGLFADVRDAANREPVSVMDTGRVLSACRGSWRRCRRRRSVARRRRQDRHAGADDCARRWEPRRREGEGGDEGGQHHVHAEASTGRESRRDLISSRRRNGRAAAISRREPHQHHSRVAQVASPRAKRATVRGRSRSWLEARGRREPERLNVKAESRKDEAVSMFPRAPRLVRSYPPPLVSPHPNCAKEQHAQLRRSRSLLEMAALFN